MMKRLGLESALLAGLVACSRSSSPPSDAGATAEVQILSLSTWLGQLDPVAIDDDAGVSHQYGGLAALATYFKSDRAASPNTIVVLDANSWGASPPLASQFADVPAVKGLAYLGADVDMLSNHNFDDGIPYLQNLVGVSGYPYVASNLTGVQTTVSPKVATPFQIVVAGPVSVGIVAITDPSAPSKTLPGNFGGITLAEPIAATNAAARAARAAGAHVVVAITDLQTLGLSAGGAHVGPLIDFAGAVEGVDVVFGYNQTAPGTPTVGKVLVVEHTWKGETYGRTRLQVKDGVLQTASATVVVPDAAAVTPDPGAVALLAPYRAQLAHVFDGLVATADGLLAVDGTERVAEVALGDFVAGAFLAKYASLGAQIAVTNGAALRDSLPSSYAPANKSLRRPATGYAAGPPYDVVVGDVYTVLPFGDFCVLRPITGATLWLMLEQSVSMEPDANNGFLQIAGFTFTYSLGAPVGARVQSVTLDDGTSVARGDATTIQLVDTDYLDEGGDDYGMLVESPPAPLRDVDAKVVLDYLETHPEITAAPAGRITQMP